LNFAAGIEKIWWIWWTGVVEMVEKVDRSGKKWEDFACPHGASYKYFAQIRIVKISYCQK